jgi:sugar/nucleoside kinase (ribokinase family)
VLAELARLGVDIAGVARCADRPTSHIVHLIEPGGRRRYVEAIGATSRLRLAAADLTGVCGAGTILLLSTAVPAAAARTAARAARRAGATRHRRRRRRGRHGA